MKYPNKIGAIIKSRYTNALRYVVVAIMFLTAAMAVNDLQAQETKEGPSYISPDTFQLAEGFNAELVYPVASEFGSWVSLTTSPMGLIASDQYGKLYNIKVGDSTSDTSVQPIDVQVGSAQGLLWAFDSLYVMAHPIKERAGGLYRVTDSDNDGQLDKATLLRKIEGGGEHGPHAIVLSPDGNSLYICAGNHTNLTSVQTSQVPRNWQEDNVIERMWDPGGHAVGKMAPGGWICKTDPEGQQWELISIGYRNQYDIAFDTNGELFTYDADMEWDIGTPWYRPTRVCHAMPGSEFGWRGGDAKWPTYYPDGVPPVIDIGPGSPTGIVFGTGADFPEKYQKALFIADWSFGFIYAIHMQPDGGTYTAEKELFCSAAALQVTDMIIHEGDLYFAIGGRRTQSALYRIKSDVSDNAKASKTELTETQLLRRQIESSETDVDMAWQHLGHEDRAIRFAARLHLERASLDDWLGKLTDETPVPERLEALLAAVRHIESNVATSADSLILPIVKTVSEWDRLTEMQRLHLLRVCGLIYTRLCNEDVKPATQELFRGLFEEHYPADSVAMNHELCRLLVASDSPSTISKTLDLIDNAVTQEEQIVYVMCLRKANNGWTNPLRERYLNWFVKSAVFQGGKSFAGYLKNARNEFVASLSGEEKTELAAVIEVEMVEQDPYAELKSREVVKQWKVADLLPAVEGADLSTRDLANGKRIFATAQCYKCHQFAGSGGIVGPDLTGLSRRFTNQYLLETLIDPNKEISSQYQATRFELENGRMITGRVANLSRENYMIQEDMITPGKLTTINRNTIFDSKPSTVSPMPANLLDSFTQEEILDLVAYLRSADQATEQAADQK